VTGNGVQHSKARTPLSVRSREGPGSPRAIPRGWSGSDHRVLTLAYVETDAILKPGPTDAVSDTRRPDRFKKAQELPVVSLDLVRGVVLSRVGDL